MKCKFHCFLSVMWVVAWGVISGSSVAQQAPQPPQAASPGITAGIAAGPGVNRGVHWLAYSADEVSVRTQTLADGTKITSKFLRKVYRDSEGRIRQESFGRQGESGEPDASPLGVRILDPVAGVSYSLNPRNYTAQKTEMRRPPPPPPQTTAASANQQPVLPQITQEDLGTRVIEGLEVSGKRTTTTIPAGAEGNDRPIKVTHEFWRSPELKEWVMSMVNDPRSGETVIRLTNLMHDEPPAALFQVPPDYTVEEIRPVESPPPPPPASSGITAGVAQARRRTGVIGFPYSAEEVTVTTQTLADGTKITQQQLTKRYQDSQGRTRQEYFGPQMGSARPDASPKGVQIFDPATGVSYSLNPLNHTARKFDQNRRIPVPPRQTTAASANPPPTPPAPPRPTIEDLGTHVVEGLRVSRRRTTTTIPAGAEGNDRPIQVTHESWYWPELRLTMMDITNDPRSGVSVMRITNLVREEPPAELFHVPPDYTVEELQPVAKSGPPSQ